MFEGYHKIIIVNICGSKMLYINESKFIYYSDFYWVVNRQLENVYLSHKYSHVNRTCILDSVSVEL